MKHSALFLALGFVLIGCGGGEKSPAQKAHKADSNAPAVGGGLIAPELAPNALPGIATTGPAVQPFPLMADTTIRQPAVAGTWYAPDRANLRQLVDTLLSATVAAVPEKVRAIIVPHASYRFSGLTAAVAYKQLMGQEIDTAVIMAGAHFSRFDGASVAPFEAYRTPLGDVPVSPKAAQLAKTAPFVLSPKAEVQRPWKTPSKLPPPGGDTPHTWEHTIEAQLPFLQRALPNCKIIPVQFGAKVNPGDAAAGLSPLLDDKTVLIVSTDLSHYHPYEEAKAIDAWFTKAVREMDMQAMTTSAEACGKGPVLTVMQIAKERGWKPRVLDYRTSADVKGGDKKSVVGYTAVAFVEEGTVKSPPLTDAEKTFLLDTARKTITSVINKQPIQGIDRASLSPKMMAPKALFVTLNKGEELKGCIGYTQAVQPLFLAVMDRAVNAALRDPRFKPVTPEEFKDITIEISVLTVPAPIYFNTPQDLLGKLRPNVDGVVLAIPVTVGNSRAVAQGVFLPMVWKTIPEPEKFMDQLTLKAKQSLEYQLSVQAKKRVNINLPANSWRQPGVTVLIFQAEDFKETKG
ncbi:MAG TPA: AmmeMemoRadiSam system protein B [Phycisphaerae bacterium]|nr:AmmeMemoRadiSam system protein B [Phycisphaerae bacterium]